MPFMKKVNEVLIMSFQTDKNGTFAPALTIASGILKWVIDGITYITNSPSVALTGSTVDIEVFANTVPLNETIVTVVFNSENIIGDLDFSHFTSIGTQQFNFNSDLTNIFFSANVNTIADLRHVINSITSIDLSNVILSNQYLAFLNSALTSISMPGYTTAVSNIDINGCGLDLTTVNSWLSSLNTFMSSNAPISNLSLNLSGGTNASPTGGASNTDLVNLRDVVYPNAGFTFTATIN